MVKSFLVSALTAILFVGLVTGEITVTFEPHNVTDETTLYGENTPNLHSMDQTQGGHDEEEVETFYVRSGVSDGDENRGDVPATQTHSPIREPETKQPDIVAITQTVPWPPVDSPQECPSCCEKCQVQPPPQVHYPKHPLFPVWGGGGSHAPVIEDDAEYINNAGGGQQVVFVNPPQRPEYQPQPPVFPPLAPEFPVQQQPPHPSIIYIPHHSTGSDSPPQIPFYGYGGNDGVNFGGGFGGINGGGGGGVEDFNGGSAHRNHGELWRLHQQQHQQWLQQQRRQQQHILSPLIVGGGGNGYHTIGNLGSVGGGVVIGGGQRRPCDSKK